MKYYVVLFLLTTLTGVSSVIYRGESHSEYKLLEWVLSSYPSFAYMLGILLAVRSYFLSSSGTYTNKFVAPILLGSLLYEVQQYWGSGVFDSNDLFALVAGVLAFFSIDGAVKKYTKYSKISNYNGIR